MSRRSTSSRSTSSRSTSSRSSSRGLKAVRRDWPKIPRLPGSWVAVYLETDHGPAILIARSYRREVDLTLRDYFDTSRGALDTIAQSGGYVR